MEEELVEFNIAHNRKYSIDHLWYQEKDDEKIMVGISEFMGVEIGDVLRIILPQAETVVDEAEASEVSSESTSASSDDVV